jgi:hypothetical protein
MLPPPMIPSFIAWSFAGRVAVGCRRPRHFIHHS